MKTVKYFMASALTVALSATSFYAMADLDAEDFIEEASERNIGEIEAAKLALQKSTHPAVKEFAQTAITVHTADLAKLRTLAAGEKVEMEDDATLMSKAKKAILKQRDGESFDAAYANNQITVHRDTAEFYKKAAKSEDAEVRAFAAGVLPVVEQHLKDAEALAAKLGADSKNIDVKADVKAD